MERIDLADRIHLLEPDASPFEQTPLPALVFPRLTRRERLEMRWATLRRRVALRIAPELRGWYD